MTLFILLLLAAALLQLLLTIEDFAGRKCVRFFWDMLLLLTELLCCEELLIVGGGGNEQLLPTWVLWLMGTALFFYAAVSYSMTLWKMQYSLSYDSIKEGSDNMSDGVCFFDKWGTVRLINRKMLSVGMRLIGSEIQTLDELHDALAQPPSDVECLDSGLALYRFQDGTVFRFTEHIITDRDGSLVTEVVAADVTKLYAKQAELNRENARFAEANRGMKRLLDNMKEIVREEEILTMKIRVHDDIGHSILSARRALLQQEDINVIRESAALWEQGADLLDRANHMPVAPDEWETLKQRAAELGVELVLNGVLPGQDARKHLLILAVRECMSNCVRHAGGNRIFVEVTHGEAQISCVITNNGRPPKQKITEGGGLSGLRRRIEREGGRMELQSQPVFALTIILPQKEELL